MSLLDRITERRPVVGHDGRSGAVLERGMLDDGTRVYLKTCEVAADVGQLLTGDARRELKLWQAGVFDQLPPTVGSALIGIDDLGDRLVTVTRDLGLAMLTWETTLSHDQLRTIFHGITSVHRSFLGSAPAGLCPLPVRLNIFSPARLDAVRSANPDLARAIARGQELLGDLIPADVAKAVHRCYDDPAPLAAALSAAPTTLLHGDFFFVNIALENELVVPLDWGLATAGPPALDLITFCVGATSNVTLDREQLLAEAANACRQHTDDHTFRLGEFWALMELGWNKALDAIDHPDPRKRATEHGDLDFWIARARRALEAGLVPDGAPSRVTGPGDRTTDSGTALTRGR